MAVSITTIDLLGISSSGVIERNLNKWEIKCACLGNVFNLPMNTITIIEDLGMVAMAVVTVLMGQKQNIIVSQWPNQIQKVSVFFFGSQHQVPE